MWLRWSALSRLPFQQSGKLTCSSRFDGAAQRGSAARTADGRRLRPHRAVERALQRRRSPTRSPPGSAAVTACEFPATISRPSWERLHGRGREPPVVDRRAERADRDARDVERRRPVGGEVARGRCRSCDARRATPASRTRRRDVPDEGVVVREPRAAAGDDRVVRCRVAEVAEMMKNAPRRRRSASRECRDGAASAAGGRCGRGDRDRHEETPPSHWTGRVACRELEPGEL